MIHANVKDWTPFLACAKAYTEEANIMIENNTARIVCIDTTHTCMVNAVIPCESDQNTVLPVKLEKFGKALSAAGDSDIEVSEGYITLHGCHAKVKVPLLSVEQKFNWPPKFSGEPSAYCDIDPSLLAPIVSYGQYVSAVIADVKISDTRMVVTVGQVPETSEIQSPSTAVGEGHSTLDVTYVDALMKLIKGTPEVTIGIFQNDAPVLFKWTMGEGQYKVIVAPRIED